MIKITSQLFTSFFILLSIHLHAQNCNCLESVADQTITNGQTAVVNAYYPGSSDVLKGSTSISIGAKRAVPTASFDDLGGEISAGDLLMIVQMQGAEIDATIADVSITINPDGIADVFQTSDYGDGPGGLDHEGFLTNENYIAGQYEFVVATNVVGSGGGTLTIKEGLTNSYISNETPTSTIGRRIFQVIKVGNYRNLTVDAGGEITTVPWNGSTGGIISLDVLGTLNLNGRIDANFAGFRGGHLDLAGGVDITDLDNGVRGEGIAGTPLKVYGFNDDFTTTDGETLLNQGYPGATQNIDVDFDFNGTLFPNTNIVWTPGRGLGAPGNAGGAGVVNNGGGGGSNGGGGGNGANEGAISSGGGAPIAIENGSRLTLGGGGGSGGQLENNDGFPETVNSGRPGGGAILIRADTLESTGSTGLITANGNSGDTFTAVNQVADENGSGGGGGGGGTVILLTSSEDLSSLSVDARGGDGAGLNGVQVFGAPDGGGGGGSGGNVMLVRRGGDFSAIPTIDVAGGDRGDTQGTPDVNSTGGDGAVSLLTTPPASNLDCPLITLSAPAPGGVTGSILWLEPNTDVTFNGTQQITAWNDLSSSNFNLTNTGVSGLSGTRPDYIVGSFTDVASSSNPDFNFNPSISFNEGTDDSDYLAFENFTNISTGEITTYAVVNFPATGPSDQTIFSYLSNDSRTDELDLGISNDGGADGIRHRLLDNSVDRTGNIRDGVTRIIATDYDNSNANIYINNETPTSVALSAGTLGTSGTFVIGQDLDAFATPSLDANRALQGQIGDVIYFSRVLSTIEHQRVSSYLSIKYGITMDQSTHQDYLNSIGEAVYPIASEAASYSNYDHDIAGIGRDDGTQLLQLRSKSINADAIMTGSLTAGFSTDRQYVVWGNNDGGTVFNTTEISAGILNRIQREWRVAVTNSVNSIDLDFDLSGTTNAPSTTDNVALIIDNDGDFSNGFLRTIVATSWDGATAGFQSININDDEVLTIASVPDSPGGVAGNILWFRADGGVTTTGNFVTNWEDQSSSGLNATATGGNRPTLQADDANFNPSISFVGGDVMNAGNNLNLNPGVDEWTFLSTFNVNLGDNGTILSRAIGGEASRQYQYFVSGDEFRQIIGGTINDDGITLATGGWTLGSATLSTSVLNSYVDGSLDDPGVPGTAPNQNTNLRIGARGASAGATFPLTGEIGEIIMFNSNLTDVERNRAESYLAIKYGITLNEGATDYVASDGDFIYETVVFPNDYNNDIAGIGRDDISALDQRISQSINTDAVVTMSLTDNGGSFASPNAFTANLSFLAWGNDNDDDGTIEDVNTDIPSNVLFRLDREWRVQEKGTVGTVTLAIDLSGVDPNGGETNFTGRSASSFLLLIDDGGDFTNGITRSFDPVSYDAVDEVVTFEVDFEDGDIFTLATSLVTAAPGGVLSNLDSWLRADQGTSTTTNHTVLTTWSDQGIEGNDATSDGNPPLYRDNETDNINGYPVVVFDGINDRLAIDLSAIIGSDYALFSVGERASDDDTQYVLGSDRGSSVTNESLHFGYRNNTTATLAQFGNDLDLGVDAFDAPETAPFIIYGEYFGSGHIMQENRNSLLRSVTNSNSDALTGSNDGFVGYFEPYFYNGKIAETIVYTSELTPEEENKVYSYLAAKYGITMNGGDYDYTSSAGSVYYPGSSDAGFASFRNDISVIGRDDNSGFEQVSSGSSNNSSVLRIVKSANFNADNQFFAWGH
ncbi:MAG: hypothetical protein AAF551_02650, partial [Bacteroidota bacterium]